MGLAAHALDELNGRPLGTRSPTGSSGASPWGSPARSARHPRGLRGLALAVGVHRRGGVPRRRLQPRAARRRRALRRVVRARVGCLPGPHRVLRPDGDDPSARRPRGGRVRGGLVRAAHPVDPGPQAASIRPDRAGRARDPRWRSRTARCVRAPRRPSGRCGGCRSRCRSSRSRCCSRGCRFGPSNHRIIGAKERAMAFEGLKTIGQIHVSVTDVDRAVEFYRDVLGLRSRRASPASRWRSSTATGSACTSGSRRTRPTGHAG